MLKLVYFYTARIDLIELKINCIYFRIYCNILSSYTANHVYATGIKHDDMSSDFDYAVLELTPV